MSQFTEFAKKKKLIDWKNVNLKEFAWFHNPKEGIKLKRKSWRKTTFQMLLMVLVMHCWSFYMFIFVYSEGGLGAKNQKHSPRCSVSQKLNGEKGLVVRRFLPSFVHDLHIPFWSWLSLPPSSVLTTISPPPTLSLSLSQFQENHTTSLSQFSNFTHVKTNPSVSTIQGEPRNPKNMPNVLLLISCTYEL